MIDGPGPDKQSTEGVCLFVYLCLSQGFNVAVGVSLFSDN